MENTKTIGRFELTALIVGATIGSGIFGISSDLANAAAPGPAILGWLIVGLGVWCLIASLNHLLVRHPKQDAGIFAYAGLVFGPLGEFISGWAYWLASWLGNLAFATIAMSALGTFWPVFKGGQNLPSILLAILLTIIFTVIVSYGVETTALLNLLGTIAKLIPLLIFVVFAILAFHWPTFIHNFWGLAQSNDNPTLSIYHQVKNSLMVMMWLFMGVESASVMAHRAKRHHDAVAASFGGWLILLVVYLLVSLLPYGVMTRSQLAGAAQPAMGTILSQLVGPWGAALISTGLIISVLVAWLSWTMLPAEAFLMMEKDQVLPRAFGRLNSHRAPTFGLWVTAIVQCLFLFSLLFTTYAYRFAYTLGTAAGLIVYFFVGLDQIKDSLQEHDYGQLMIGILLTIFELLSLALAGWRQVMVLSLSLLPGFLIYWQACRLHKQRLTKGEWLAMALISILAVVSLILILNKTIPIE